MCDKEPGKEGKNADKGGKGAKSGACHICQKTGHYARDCWKRVNQVEERGKFGGATSTTASVKMVLQKNEVIAVWAWRRRAEWNGYRGHGPPRQ